MKRVIGATLAAASVLFAGECARPPEAGAGRESPVALSLAVIAALATVNSAYQESILSPEMSVTSSDIRPLASAKRCVDAYTGVFSLASSEPIKSTAESLLLAMNILEENERVLQNDIGKMSAAHASPDAIMAHAKDVRDSGLGRWSIFLNVATAVTLAISHFATPGVPRSGEILSLDSDEATLLRFEILRHFSRDRLTRPASLLPSPEKGAAMLYRLLSTGKLDVSDKDWN